MDFKKRFLFIGVGQAGGNLAALFEEKGYNVICINTSAGDLATLKNVKHKYHIEGGDGAAKDRDRAKELITNDAENIFKLIENSDENISDIFVMFSAGGGTGSGAGPMLADILSGEYPDTNINIATILPGSDETPTAFQNAYFCMDEIIHLESIGAVFILDNKAFPSFKMINSEFADHMNLFLNTPAADRSTLGNIDEEEIRTVLSAGGMAILTAVPKSNSDKTTATADIIKSLDNNVYAPREKDNILRYIAVSLADKNAAMSSTLSEIQKAVGRPLDSFMTQNERGRTITCISGLTYPKTRLVELADKVKEYSEQEKDTGSRLLKLDKIPELKPAKPKRAKRLRADIMAKYMKK